MMWRWAVRTFRTWWAWIYGMVLIRTKLHIPIVQLCKMCPNKMQWNRIADERKSNDFQCDDEFHFVAALRSKSEREKKRRKKKNNTERIENERFPMEKFSFMSRENLVSENAKFSANEMVDVISRLAFYTKCMLIAFMMRFGQWSKHKLIFDKSQKPKPNIELKLLFPFLAHVLSFACAHSFKWSTSNSMTFNYFLSVWVRI